MTVDDGGVPLGERPVPRARKRRRFGALVGSTKPVTFDPERAVVDRERQEKSNRLLKGGVSKGATKGYGIARPPKREP